MTRGSQLIRDVPHPRGADLGRVLPFRRPGRPPPAVADSVAEAPDGHLPDDLAKYEIEPDEVIDYRHRALMNVIALAVLTLLLIVGVWLANTISQMQRDQDCVLQGRVNCAPFELPPPKDQ